MGSVQADEAVQNWHCAKAGAVQKVGAA